MVKLADLKDSDLAVAEGDDMSITIKFGDNFIGLDCLADLDQLMQQLMMLRLKTNGGSVDHIENVLVAAMFEQGLIIPDGPYIVH
jgi:hypothetical protein